MFRFFETKWIIYGFFPFLFLSNGYSYSFLYDGVSKIYENKNYSEGIQKLEERVSGGEKDFFKLGNFYYRNKDYAKAEQAFQNSEDEKSSYNLGNSQFMQGKFSDAISSYEQFLKKFPEDPDAKHNLELAKKMNNSEKNKEENKQDKSDKNNSKNKDDNKEKEQKNNQSGDNKNDNSKNENKSTEKNDEQKSDKGKSENSREGQKKENNENNSSEPKKGENEETSRKNSSSFNESENNKKEEAKGTQGDSREQNKKIGKKPKDLSYKSRHLLNQVEEGRKKISKKASA